MAWNLPPQKSPHPSGKAPDGQRPEGLGFLQYLNCFADGRFHPLRFSVLLALVLLVLLLGQEGPALKQSFRQAAQEAGLMSSSAVKGDGLKGDAAK